MTRSCKETPMHQVIDEMLKNFWFQILCIRNKKYVVKYLNYQEKCKHDMKYKTADICNQFSKTQPLHLLIVKS